MSSTVALQVTERIERLSNIHDCRQSQRLCGSEQLLRHRRVAEDLHDPPYLTLHLPVDHDAVSQGEILRSLLSADGVQETVVMLGRHFDQYLQELKVIMRAQKNKKKYDNIPKFCALRNASNSTRQQATIGMDDKTDWCVNRAAL